MRTFYFKARNIGQENYLTYTMGEDCELDEDVLDYCEENNLKELVDIIYEEDDDYDYLTYDITERTSLEAFIQQDMTCEKVLLILRNIADGLISLKEQTIHLSYILLNKRFIYIDGENCDISFICIPVESKGSVAAEFKGFVRQLLANMRYDVDENLGYVGKLLTYINGDNFNLRGLIGLAEALMEENGISFEAVEDIDADGVEVVNAEEPIDEPDKEDTEKRVADFMSSLDEQGEVLPEIGDDEETEEEEEAVVEDEELDSILPAGMIVPDNEPDEELESDAVTEEKISADAGVKDKPSPDVQDILDTIVPDSTEEKTDEAGESKDSVVSRASKAVKTESIEEDASVKTDKESEEYVTDKTESYSNDENGKAAEEADEKTKKSQQKETDIDLIKNRIKELVGDTPPAKAAADSVQEIKTLEDLDEFLESKPPVVKKTVVKVNRAAIIQSAAAEHENEENNAGDAADTPNGSVNNTDTGKVPVIEDIYEDMNVEKDGKEKPKSKSILSKSVSDAPKTNTLLNAPKAVPYLIRVNTEERIMLRKLTFKIGKASRGVDYTVSGNGAISRQHAIIIQKDGVCYIKDNKSTNHTYVNGHIVEDGAEEILTHDSMIKLGDEEFIFKIR